MQQLYRKYVVYQISHYMCFILQPIYKYNTMLPAPRTCPARYICSSPFRQYYVEILYMC